MDLKKSKQKEPLYRIELTDETHLHLSKGNTKMGESVMNFSTLPGDKAHQLRAHGQLLTDIGGTCSGNCGECFKECYARRSAERYHNRVIKAWGDNTLLLRTDPDRLFKEIDEQMSAKRKKTELFRINVSGEIESAEELERWNRLAAKHPETKFGIYTKNFVALDEFMQKNGDTEENLCVNVSQWHHVADWILLKYPGKFNVFEYDDSRRKDSGLTEAEEERLQACSHCPAVTAEGKHAKKPNGDTITCSGCTHCYEKTGTVRAVYSH